MLVSIEQHVDWITECIEHMRDHQLQLIEPTLDAEEEWVAHVNEVAEGTMFTAPSCNSWSVSYTHLTLPTNREV